MKFTIFIKGFGELPIKSLELESTVSSTPTVKVVSPYRKVTPPIGNDVDIYYEGNLIFRGFVTEFVDSFSNDTFLTNVTIRGLADELYTLPAIDDYKMISTPKLYLAYKWLDRYGWKLGDVSQWDNKMSPPIDTDIVATNTADMLSKILDTNLEYFIVDFLEKTVHIKSKNPTLVSFMMKSPYTRSISGAATLPVQSVEKIKSEFIPDADIIFPVGDYVVDWGQNNRRITVTDYLYDVPTKRFDVDFPIVETVVGKMGCIVDTSRTKMGNLDIESYSFVRDNPFDSATALGGTAPYNCTIFFTCAGGELDSFEVLIGTVSSVLNKQKWMSDYGGYITIEEYDPNTFPSGTYIKKLATLSSQYLIDSGVQFNTDTVTVIPMPSGIILEPSKLYAISFYTTVAASTTSRDISFKVLQRRSYLDDFSMHIRRKSSAENSGTWSLISTAFTPLARVRFKKDNLPKLLLLKTNASVQNVDSVAQSDDFSEVGKQIYDKTVSEYFQNTNTEVPVTIKVLDPPINLTAGMTISIANRRSTAVFRNGIQLSSDSSDEFSRLQIESIKYKASEDKFIAEIVASPLGYRGQVSETLEIVNAAEKNVAKDYGQPKLFIIDDLYQAVNEHIEVFTNLRSLTVDGQPDKIKVTITPTPPVSVTSYTTYEFMALPYAVQLSDGVILESEFNKSTKEVVVTPINWDSDIEIHYFLIWR